MNLKKNTAIIFFIIQAPGSGVHDKQEIYYEPDACNRQGTGLGSACLPHPDQWKRINSKQSARWQHLSWLKASAFLLENFLVMC